MNNLIMGGSMKRPPQNFAFFVSRCSLTEEIRKFSGRNLKSIRKKSKQLNILYECVRNSLIIKRPPQNFTIFASRCSRAQRRCRVKNGSAIHKMRNRILGGNSCATQSDS